MGRKVKNTKPLIYVFCEGESEQAYTKFLKEKFKDVAVIKYPSKPELFKEANDRFKKDPKYKNSAEVTDEIWFFFDLEVKDIDKWERRLKIINILRKLRKKPNIRIRLLMTTGCIKYWLMLHYKMYAPPLQTTADKQKVLSEIRIKEPTYSKGDYTSTARIAENFPTAVVNAKNIVHNLDGLPCLEDTDERNEWLYKSNKTFSTVYEAIEYLEQI